jgi:hypothetical protein
MNRDGLLEGNSVIGSANNCPLGGVRRAVQLLGLAKITQPEYTMVKRYILLFPLSPIYDIDGFRINPDTSTLPCLHERRADCVPEVRRAPSSRSGVQLSDCKLTYKIRPCPVGGKHCLLASLPLGGQSNESCFCCKL